jgi:hypothetical protein
MFLEGMPANAIEKKLKLLPSLVLNFLQPDSAILNIITNRKNFMQLMPIANTSFTNYDHCACA